MLLLALGLRLHGVGFGLPALNDPDEPLFVMTALDMLRDHSLDPGWFGHPATTTLYCLATIFYLIGAIGIATARFADAHAFVSAVYADPGIIFLPGRLFIVACGVACVWLTYRIGTRIGDRRLGLLAAFFLAVNAVHIEYSQIIRTDVQASVFMLMATLSALAIARDGGRRDYLLAGVCVGLACATKWPAAAVLIGPFCAALPWLRRDRAALANIALLFAVSVATLLLVSPYLLLDYQTVLYDLAGEARPKHPGATGSGFLGNFVWYISHPLLRSLGWAGLILVGPGLVAMTIRNARARVAIVPMCLTFLVLISVQSLVWERWIVPLLPFAALAMAYALRTAMLALVRAFGGRILAFEWAAAAMLAIPMLQAAWTSAEERLHDTRQVASAWVRANVSPGSSILVEHAAFDIFQGPWHLRFPIGTAGCVDVRQALGGHMRYSRVEKLRRGSPVVDIGYVDASRLQTCRADYAVFSHYARYAEDSEAFAPQLAQYLALMRTGSTVMVIRPVAGRSSGPEIVIVKSHDHDNRGMQSRHQANPRREDGMKALMPRNKTKA
ncbi:MAG: glycosyltransferase family 39 protein [Sphingomonas sp.]